MNSKEYTLPNGKKAVFEYDVCGIGKITLECMDELMAMIADAPSIDIEPKRGEWICHKGGWIDFDYYPTKYECNQCHHYVDVASDKNFCPNCGADMRGKDDE